VEIEYWYPAIKIPGKPQTTSILCPGNTSATSCGMERLFKVLLFLYSVISVHSVRKNVSHRDHKEHGGRDI
jgi:hypothetical protein